MKKVSLLSIIALISCLYSCNFKNNHSNETNADSVVVEKLVIADTYHLSGDTAKPACKVVLTMEIPVKYKQDSDYLHLQKILSPLTFGDEYTGDSLKQAAQKVVESHLNAYKEIEPEFEKDYFRTLTDFVKSEYSQYQIFPPGKLIFNAFNLCPFDKVKVVIIGQDPYHGPGQAHGLCFSVNDGVPFPPSLVNIFKEIKADIGTDAPATGNLTRWAEQGVLLLNATLTVRAHQAGSHQNRGWETFTDAAIRALAEEKENLIFILWGSYAQKKGAFIDRNKHLVLTSAHPSPLSAYNGFFGNKHFSRTNDYLKAHGETEIAW